jgi:hypothetical protein
MRFRGVLPALSFAVCVLGGAPVLRAQQGAAGNTDAPSKPVRSSIQPEQAVSKVNEELIALQWKIRAARAKALENRKAQHRTIRDLAGQHRAVARTLQVLETETADLEKELTQKKTQLAGEQKKLADLEEPTKKLLESMKEYLDKVEAHVESGMPWQKTERKRAIQQVRDLLGAEDATPSAGLGAVGRIHQEEESLGRLVESGTVEVNLGKEAVAVQAFHLGLLAVIFANEDATVIGFARAGETLEEGLEATMGNPEAASGYMAAVDILRRRRTPSIIDLYLPSLPVREEGGAE